MNGDDEIHRARPPPGSRMDGLAGGYVSRLTGSHRGGRTARPLRHGRPQAWAVARRVAFDDRMVKTLVSDLQDREQGASPDDVAVSSWRGARRVPGSGDVATAGRAWRPIRVSANPPDG